jgi:ABC-type multidrug transport system fused ATPase/permease subunit
MIDRLRKLRATMRRLDVSLRILGFLFVLNMLTLVFEALGVAMLLPALELLGAGGSVDETQLKGWYWDIIRRTFADLGIPVNLGALLAVSFLFLLSRQFFNYLNVRSQSVVQRSLAHRIRQRAFLSFLLARTTLQERTRIGEIAGGLTSELNNALGAMFASVATAGHLVHVVLYVTGLFFLSVPMTLFSIGMISLTAFLARNYLAEVRRTGAAITDANIQINAFIIERLKNVRLIRLSGTEKGEAAAFAQLSRRDTEQRMRQKLVSTRMMLLPEPLLLGFGYLVLFVGWQIFGLSSLAFFVIILARLAPVVRGIISDYNTIVGKWPSVDRVDKYLKNVLEAREDKGGDRRFERLDEGVRYDHVSFAYGADDTPALADVTVTLPAHRMTALVGPSGAGKSTFVDLLPRLREPSKGQILFDGVSIEEFSIDSLRRGIAFVPQQPQIFDITAAQHIRYGKEDASDSEVREAARLAGALGFIDALPQGFDTLLGDGGFRLSGGQRQRLDIARALVRRAPILILDEPSSALDAEAEAAFRDALRTLRTETDLTIIVIAHRLSTIADAELIVVMKEGRVESAGTHEELLATGGWYARSYSHQVDARATVRTLQRQTYA